MMGRYNEVQLQQKLAEIKQKEQAAKKRKEIENEKFEKRQETIGKEDKILRERKKARTKDKPIPRQSLTNNSIFNLADLTKSNTVANILNETSETPQIPEGANKSFPPINFRR